MPETTSQGTTRRDGEDEVALPLAATMFAFLILILAGAAMAVDGSARDLRQDVATASLMQPTTQTLHPGIVAIALVKHGFRK